MLSGCPQKNACLRTLGLLWLTLPTFIPAQAQTSANVQAASGKEVQIGYHASAGKDCKPAPLPNIRLTEFPKNGTLLIKHGTITTDRIPNCQQLQTAVVVIFYQSKSEYVGLDEMTYAVHSTNGEIQTVHVGIKVNKASLKDAAPASPESQKL